MIRYKEYKKEEEFQSVKPQLDRIENLFMFGQYKTAYLEYERLSVEHPSLFETWEGMIRCNLARADQPLISDEQMADLFSHAKVCGQNLIDPYWIRHLQTDIEDFYHNRAKADYRQSLDHVTTVEEECRWIMDACDKSLTGNDKRKEERDKKLEEFRNEKDKLMNAPLKNLRKARSRYTAIEGILAVLAIGLLVFTLESHEIIVFLMIVAIIWIIINVFFTNRRNLRRAIEKKKRLIDRIQYEKTIEQASYERELTGIEADKNKIRSVRILAEEVRMLCQSFQNNEPAAVIAEFQEKAMGPVLGIPVKSEDSLELLEQISQHYLMISNFDHLRRDYGIHVYPLDAHRD